MRPLKVGERDPNRGIPACRDGTGNIVRSTSPIVANGVLYCAGSRSLRALEPQTGRELWSSSEIGGIHWQSPIVANGKLYITDEGGCMTAFAAP